MVKRISTSASSNNCLHWWGDKFAFWNKILIIKYCQYTMTAIQMIKWICISHKFIQKMSFCPEIKILLFSSASAPWLQSKWLREFAYVPNSNSFSQKKKMNFHLEIKLTVNSSWFQLYEPNKNNLKSKWSRETTQEQVPTTAFIDGGDICFLK